MVNFLVLINSISYKNKQIEGDKSVGCYFGSGQIDGTTGPGMRYHRHDQGSCRQHENQSDKPHSIHPLAEFRPKPCFSIYCYLFI